MKFNGIIIGTIPFHLQAFALRTFISQYGITEPLFEKCSSDGKSVPYFDSAKAKVNRAILHFLPEIRTWMSKSIQNNRGVQKWGRKCASSIFHTFAFNFRSTASRFWARALAKVTSGLFWTTLAKLCAKTRRVTMESNTRYDEWRKKEPQQNYLPLSRISWIDCSLFW